MDINDVNISITIDIAEIISLRNAKYLEDDEIDNKEAVTNAIHALIADIYKMNPEYREDCWF